MHEFAVHLRRWLLPHIVTGGVVMVAVLVFLLFSEDYEFELWSIAIIPLLAAIAGGLLVEVIAPRERALRPAGVCDAIVAEAARATFNSWACTTRSAAPVSWYLLRSASAGSSWSVMSPWSAKLGQADLTRQAGVAGTAPCVRGSLHDPQSPELDETQAPAGGNLQLKGRGGIDANQLALAVEPS